MEETLLPLPPRPSPRLSSLPPVRLIFSLFPREEIMNILLHCPGSVLLCSGSYETQEWSYLMKSDMPGLIIRSLEDAGALSPGSQLIMPSLPSWEGLLQLSGVVNTVYIILHADTLLKLKASQYKKWENLFKQSISSKIMEECPLKLLSKTEKWGYTEKVLFSVLKSTALGLSLDQIHSIVTGQHRKEAHYPGYGALRATGKKQILEALNRLINAGILCWYNKRLKASGKGKR